MIWWDEVRIVKLPKIKPTSTIWKFNIDTVPKMMVWKMYLLLTLASVGIRPKMMVLKMFRYTPKD